MPELRSSLFQFLYNLNTNQLALGQLGRGLECLGLGVWGSGNAASNEHAHGRHLLSGLPPLRALRTLTGKHLFGADQRKSRRCGLIFSHAAAKTPPQKKKIHIQLHFQKRAKTETSNCN